jgi:hypothetical protein
MIDRRRFLLNLGLGGAATLGVACTGYSTASLSPAPPDDRGFAQPPPGKQPNLEAWRDALTRARRRAIARLHEYRTAGRFPRNHRVLGHIPTFVDEHGTACAVGFLMQRSGHDELVEEIVRTDNHVYIEHITEGPALDWIRFSGLTQEECAVIQPSYDWERPMPVPMPPRELDRERLRTHFASVEQQLLRDSETSLDTALALLEPRIRNGAPIDRVVR